MAFKIINDDSYEFIEGRKIITLESPIFTAAAMSYIYNSENTGFEILATLDDPILLGVHLLNHTLTTDGVPCEIPISQNFILFKWSLSTRSILVNLINFTNDNYRVGDNISFKFILAAKDE